MRKVSTFLSFCFLLLVIIQQNQVFFFLDTLSSGMASCNQQRTFNTASNTEKKMEKKQSEFKTPPRSTERQSN